MDSRPNFSFGLSQLDAQEENIPIVGFVTGTFDYEEPNFAENRSKHRNDLVAMKKLKKVASSRSKKSVSKSASKKKVDDSGRPRLPKMSADEFKDDKDSILQNLRDNAVMDPSCGQTAVIEKKVIMIPKSEVMVHAIVTNIVKFD
ncbi:hypothetical protein FXO37_00793 [Capsicum annuum]|nr:hypothetical protein FXO37_00793 [Capsicum annuum]